MSTKANGSISAILSSTLRRGKSRASKSIRQGANQLVEEAKIGRKAADPPPKPSKRKIIKQGAADGSVKSAPFAVNEAETTMVQFESDIEKRNAVERARNDLIPRDLPDLAKKVERLKRIASDSPKSVNEVLQFGLQQNQATTINSMLGQLFGQTIKLTGGKELRRSQESANKLMSKLKGHWDKALPPGQSREKALQSAFDSLQEGLKKDPKLNPSRFIREILFNGWRKRFMERLGADSALVAELKAATGINILKEKGTPRFSLKLKIGNSEVQFGFDVDHAKTRLSDAVKAAKRPEDLLWVIDSDGMQLLTPRENRIQIEALRKATQKYFENADEETLAHFKRMNTSSTELEKEIDAMIQVLDRPGDFI
jgi:hypothetical protein